MTISVLIPAHNEGAVLHECLAAIRGQTIPVDQIVVVADACTDNTVEVARSVGCDVIETNEQAKAASQDAGLAYVTGEYLVCVDADTVLAPDVVEKFMAELDHVDATCANMLPMPQQRGFWVANRRFAYALGRYWWRWCQAEIGRLMVLSGCAYALKTETVRSIGGFPGQLITCDMDLTWSLYGAGYRDKLLSRSSRIYLRPRDIQRLYEADASMGGRVLSELPEPQGSGRNVALGGLGCWYAICSIWSCCRPSTWLAYGSRSTMAWRRDS